MLSDSLSGASFVEMDEEGPAAFETAAVPIALGAARPVLVSTRWPVTPREDTEPRVMAVASANVIRTRSMLVGSVGVTDHGGVLNPAYACLGYRKRHAAFGALNEVEEG